MNSLKGTGVALVTPFDEKGNVDTQALSRLVDYVVDGGVEYLVILGTTGESVTLSKDEKKTVIETVRKANKGRLPMVLGVGGNDTAQVINELKNPDLNDMAAILSVSPYYNKPTQAGIYAHYAAIAAASPLPIILYNVPGRTGCNVAADTVVRLANDFKNIVAVKEASGNMAQVMDIINRKPKDFVVLSGDDALTLPIIACGGEGVISVVGEAAPRKFSNMVRAAMANQMDEARKLHYQLLEFTDLLFAEGNPAGVKAALTHFGVMNNLVRLPLVNASKELNDKIVETIKKHDLK
jgi:4-hydroxy-tetrahydrodipicolinate synthase